MAKKNHTGYFFFSRCGFPLPYLPHRYNTISACTCEVKFFTLIQALSIVVPVHLYAVHLVHR